MSATRAQILSASLAYAVGNFYAKWGTATLPGYTVYFGYNGNWFVAPTGTESKIGYYSYAPLNVVYSAQSALQNAATTNAVDDGFNIFS